MRRLFTIIALLFISNILFAQSSQAYKAGEWFKFRIHYGPFNASYATLQVKETTLDDKEVYHVEGEGRSTGLLHLFFKVEDYYQTYIDKEDGKPYKFVRKINEGGHTKDLEIDFDHQENKAYVHDKKHNENRTYTTRENVHDMLSAFYYIRNNIENDELSPGDEIHLNMFLDGENMDFKVKFLEREIVRTKFGKVASLKFRPYVMAGRVFKEKESLTFWISDDANKIPVKIEADLAVGSLDVDLDGYRGLKHPFRIIMD